MSYDYGYDYGYSSTAATGAAAGILGGSIVSLVISLLVGVLMIASMWKIFTKAGKPGWASIIPIYNIIVMLEIAELPTWYIVLFLIPFANIYAAIKIYLGLAKRFGKSTGFAIGMIFLPLIFFPILAFAKDSEPVAEPAAPVQPEPVAPAAPVQPEPIPVQPVQEPVPEPIPVAPVAEPAPVVEPAPIQPEVPVQEPVATEPFPTLGNVVEKPASESTITEGMPEVSETPVEPIQPVEPAPVVSDATLAETAQQQTVQNTDFMNTNQE